MKKNNYLLCLLTILWLTVCTMALQSCRDIRTPDMEDVDPPASELLPLGLYSIDSQSPAATRAASSPLDEGTKIGFYVKTATTEKGNVEGGYDSSDRWWTTTGDNKIWISKDNASMTVYAPYDVAHPANRLNLRAAVMATDASNDLMAGTMTVNSSNLAAGISLTLSHLYTCLQFTFVKDAGYTCTVAIDRLELPGADLYSTADYAPYTKVYIATSIAGEVSLPVSGVLVPTDGEVLTGATPAVIRTLLIPLNQAFTADAHLWVTLRTSGVNVQRLGVKIPKETFTPSRPFAPGKQYNFRVRILPTDMKLEGVEVAEWADAFTTDKDMALE